MLLNFGYCFANELTLQEAVDLAYKNDRGWRIAKSKNLEAQEFVPRALSQLLPSLSVNLNSNQVSQQLTNGSVISPEQRYPSQTKFINLRQPLLISRQLENLNLAKYQELQAGFLKLDESQQLLVRVVSAYFDAVSERTKFDLVKSQRKELETKFAAAVSSLKAGQVSQIDVDEVNVRLDITKSNELKLEQSYKLALKQLENIVGVNVSKIENHDLSIKKIVLLNPEPLNAYIEKYFSGSPKIQIQRREIEIAEANLKVALKGHLPTFDLIAQVGRSNGENTYFTNTKNDNKFIGVQLNFPLYSGGSTQSQIRTYVAKLEQAKEQFELTADNLRTQIQKEHDSLTYNIKMVTTLDLALKSADQILLSNKKGVSAGTKSSLDVLQAENQRLEVFLNLTQAQHESLKAWIRLMSILGENSQDKIVFLYQNIIN